MIVPAGFAADLAAAGGGAARAWLDLLPALADSYLRRWRLVPAGEPMHGTTAVVLPVHAARTEAMLKLGWPHPESEHEALALRTWDGRGAVRLLDCDEGDGVLLLERLDSAMSLHALDPGPAIEVLAELLRRLTVPATAGLRSMAGTAGLHPIPGTAGLRSMAGIARRWRRELPAEAARLGHPVPAALLDAAVAACATLGPTAGSAMVNEDLHYANVLRGKREPWLVIDPKVLAGDPEFAVIPMLWNRFEEAGGTAGLGARFDSVVSTAGLDARRARGWTLARAVDTWLWHLAHGGTEPGAAVCAAIATWAVDGWLAG